MIINLNDKLLIEKISEITGINYNVKELAGSDGLLYGIQSGKLIAVIKDLYTEYDVLKEKLEEYVK